MAAGQQMTQSYEQTAAHVVALTGSIDSVINWRCIHDVDKGVPAHVYHGTLEQVWPTLCDYNNRGYGIFLNINCMDGVGNYLDNVQYIRAHVVDLDNVLTAVPSYHQAVNSQPLPAFAVQTSPNKFHIYWVVQPYTGNEYFTIQQRKLAQLYNGDPTIIDAARVLRVAGFYHLKGTPSMVTCWQLGGYGSQIPVQALAQTLEHINVIESGGSRHELGDKELAAPSLEWLAYSLSLINPNDLDRYEWISFTAAFKQAGWSLADEKTLFDMWSTWCSQYSTKLGNDESENLKQWSSIRETEVGWKSIVRRAPTISAAIQFGHKRPQALIEQQQQLQQQQAQPIVEEEHCVQGPDPTKFPEILSEYECKDWFKDCTFIARTGEIFSPSGRFMNSTKFNGNYGGKHFVITTTGKTTDEAWKAALRSTCWTIPKVDHVRFLPDQPKFSIIEDRIGRKGLNTYVPVKPDARQGDVTPWLQWFDKILPNKNDQRIFFEYLAHCVKYPGHKIPWAPMLQSAEGVGKTIFREVMGHALGDMYVYSPKAPELVSSGSTFNAWMRGKLMIIVDEIKIDERRELIEILKPMITDNRVEIQSKGVDQDMEDNPANWIFFSNYKDAIPINSNGRRYAIFYSALQSRADIEAAGMDSEYFNKLWSWLRFEGGLQAVSYWLLHYPINRGDLPVRAPETSSYDEARRISRTPAEVIIADAVSDALEGFRGGYVSLIAALRMLRSAGIKNPTNRTVQVVLEHMGYVELGRAPRPFMREDVTSKTVVYGALSTLRVEDFGKVQGYEN